MNRILVYAIIGRICVFFLQKFPFVKLPWVGKWFEDGGFLFDLFHCDLCLGTWVFTFFAVAMQLNLLDVYIPGVSELVTGAIISLIVWLVRIGWQTQFGIIEVR
jgi:hypothetical protein